MNKNDSVECESILSQFTIEELIEEVESRDATVPVYVVSTETVDMLEIGDFDDAPSSREDMLRIFYKDAIVYLPHEDCTLRFKDMRNSKRL